MTTKTTKVQTFGPKITKKQREEAFVHFLDLSAPRKTNTIEEVRNVIDHSTLSNEDINDLISLLKSKKTSGKSGPSTGVGARCKELIKSGLGNKDVLNQIKDEFPSNNTSYSCIAWYRNDMKQKGEL